VTPARVTVVFGGGGARSAAQVGALRALAEAGLRPSRYVGTSMGGVIAAGAAGGADPDELSRRFRSVRVRDVARPRLLTPVAGLWLPSLLRAEPMRETLARMVPRRSFAELAAPLSLTAVDLDSRELVVLGDGGLDLPLADALAATTALPVYYPPVEVAGRRLADGGLRAVLPLDVAARFPADLVVAIDVSPSLDQPGLRTPAGGPRLLQAHDTSEGILLGQQAQDAVARWHATPGLPRLVHVRPPLPVRATFAVERFAEFESAGREATRAAIAQEGLHG